MPVVIAAGGRGRRMVADKPSQMLGGSSLIELVLRRASAMSATIAIAVQETPSWPVPDGVDYLYDVQPDSGPLSALSSALLWGSEHGASHVLLIPCDMPFLPDDLLSRLADAVGGANVAMAKSNARLHPICALWSIAAVGALPDYAQNSRRSLIGFAEHLGMAEAEWPVKNFDPFFNINTPEDLAHARQAIASGVVTI